MSSQLPDNSNGITAGSYTEKHHNRATQTHRKQPRNNPSSFLSRSTPILILCYLLQRLHVVTVARIHRSGCLPAGVSEVSPAKQDAHFIARKSIVILMMMMMDYINVRPKADE